MNSVDYPLTQREKHIRSTSQLQSPYGAKHQHNETQGAPAAM
jgi:hypothetical protein